MPAADPADQERAREVTHVRATGEYIACYVWATDDEGKLTNETEVEAILNLLEDAQVQSTGGAQEAYETYAGDNVRIQILGPFKDNAETREAIRRTQLDLICIRMSTGARVQGRSAKAPRSMATRKASVGAKGAARGAARQRRHMPKGAEGPTTAPYNRANCAFHQPPASTKHNRDIGKTASPQAALGKAGEANPPPLPPGASPAEAPRAKRGREADYGPL